MSWKNNKLTKCYNKLANHWKTRNTGGKIAYGVSALVFTAASIATYGIAQMEKLDDQQKLILGLVVTIAYATSGIFAKVGYDGKKLTPEEQAAQDAFIEAAVDDMHAGANLDAIKKQFDLDDPKDPEIT